MKYLKIVLLTLLCAYNISCNSQSKEEVKASRPNQAELHKLWSKEKHRLEISYCKLYYNDKQILLFDSMAVLKRTLGMNYQEEMGQLFYQDVPVFVMPRKRFKGNVSFAEAQLTKASFTTVPIHIQIMMGDPLAERIIKNAESRSDSLGYSIPSAKYVKINGAIITSDMMPEEINELMKINKKPAFFARRSWAYAKAYSSAGVRMSYCLPDPRLKYDNWTDIEITYQRTPDGEEKRKLMHISSISYEYTDNEREIMP